jgi:hypothetical protein
LVPKGPFFSFSSTTVDWIKILHLRSFLSSDFRPPEAPTSLYHQINSTFLELYFPLGFVPEVENNTEKGNRAAKILQDRKSIKFLTTK